MNTAYIQDGLALKLFRIAGGRICNVDEIEGILLRAPPAQEHDKSMACDLGELADTAAFRRTTIIPIVANLGPASVAALSDGMGSGRIADTRGSHGTASPRRRG